MEYKNVNDYEVLYMIKENDDYAQELMYKKYSPIVKGIASKYFNFSKYKGADYEDLEQEGYVGLSNAINTYRENGGSLFYTYATLCIERQINLFCRRLSSKKNEVLNSAIIDDFIFLNEVDCNDFSNPENFSIYNFTKEQFISFKNKFDLDCSSVFELKYNGFTYKEIAALLDISVSTVDGRLSKIRRTLHNLY